MEKCDCRGLPGAKERILTLECLECKAGVVTCPHCGKPEWWSSEKRRFALNAAEAHRWQTGHLRVVARGFGAGYEGHIVMEVGGRVKLPAYAPSAPPTKRNSRAQRSQCPCVRVGSVVDCSRSWR